MSLSLTGETCHTSLLSYLTHVPPESPVRETDVPMTCQERHVIPLACAKGMTQRYDMPLLSESAVRETDVPISLTEGVGQRDDMCQKRPIR